MTEPLFCITLGHILGFMAGVGVFATVKFLSDLIL